MRGDGNGGSSTGLDSSSSSSHLHSSVSVTTATQTPSYLRAAGSKVFAMIPKRYARIVLVVALVVSMTFVYVTMFKHPPPDQLIQMNSGGSDEFNLRAFQTGSSGFGHGGNAHRHNTKRRLRHNKHDVEEEEEEEEEDEELIEKDDEKDDGEDDLLKLLDDDGDGDEEKNVDEEEEGSKDVKEKDEDLVSSKAKEDKAARRRHNSDGREKATEDSTPAAERGGKGNGEGEGPREGEGRQGELRGKAVWDKFTKDNHFTTIGIVLDRCENPSAQLGTVVLLQDKENGGVKSRTFYNFTLEKELDEGWTFNLEVKYNGQELYDNWWEICEMEDDEDEKDRTFICPIKPGPHSLIKDKHVPGYLPKGKYQSKAWVKDPKSNIVLCGFSTFVL